ncbi:MAG: cytochrome c1, partial [Ramlibacter sp.]|nr:cytochrome c1 [Ramlibacter sp.]
LRAFLAKPHDVRPSGRMPSLNLDENAAWEIANFLRQDAQGKSTESLAFRAYEGEWTKLPDFDGMKPVKIGNSAGFDLANSPRNKGFAMRFEGFVRIDREDEYSFMLSSDDGSMLWVDGRRVVDNDGIHPNQSAVGRVKLSPGFHKLVVGYFDGGGEVELAVEIESRDMPRQSIDPYLSLTDAPAVRKAKDEPIAFVADPARSERGRALFSSLGCASCHQLKRDGKPIESTLATKDLDAVNPAAGCLAPTPSAGSPKYALDAGQKSALSAAVKVLAAKPAPPSPTESIARTLTTFNCYGCHARNGEGGVEESRKFLFATTYQDLGEEGRIPPSLNGVGTKITPKYLDELLANGAKDRPYMNTRMPKFGAGNVGALASHLIAIDATTPIAKAELTGPEKKEKSIGRHLVGTQAFGCVQCHNFRGERSAGIPALDMSSMTRRLNHDWFVRYLVDPQAYRPGTRMPSSWPKPESQLTDILDGNSRKQMEAVWLYLSDGSNANPPFGIGRSPIPLVADKNAVIYRAFIQGAGTRGIGVGLPEKVNYAFDANEGRIAMIWQGAFMDAAKHWIGRGEGFQPPLGDDILHLHDGPTIAKLADERQPWPRSDRASDLHKFQGYRISSDNRPTFRYQAGTIAVEDSPNGVAAQGKAAARIRRTLALTSAGNEPNVWYRAAVGATIEPTGDGWYKIDGEWSTKVEGGAEPIVRLSGGKAELIAPVKFSGGKATVTQTYQW